MKDLHLQYLCDTGKHAVVDLWDFYYNVNDRSLEQDDAVKTFLDLYSNVYETETVTADYVQWLENKIIDRS